MVECERYAYKSRKDCLCPAEVYIERFCNWRNKDNDCGDYTPKIGLTDRLKILEGKTGIVSEIGLDATALILSVIISR